MHTYSKITTRWLALFAALVISQVICGVITEALFSDISSELTNNTQVDWLAFFLVAAAEVSVMYYLLSTIQTTRLNQTLILFAFYWGTKFLQMLIEAAFYLNIWQTKPIMSWSEILFSAVFATLTCLLYCPIATFVAGTSTDEHCSPCFPLPEIKPALKVAALYVPIYFIAGMLLAIPLAGTSFQNTYENLQTPAWLPLFQFGRGLLWATIIWLLVGNHHHRKDSKITTAIGLSVFSGIQLLQPNPYMEENLRFAHMIEIMASMAIFGWLSAWIFERSRAN